MGTESQLGLRLELGCVLMLLNTAEVLTDGNSKKCHSTCGCGIVL